MSEQRYLTVAALTKYLKRKMELDPHLRNVWLRGEISNFKLHSRGHMYLTIKDDEARMQAVMFAGNNKNLAFMPENGMNVLVRGEVNVFESYGQYQLYIKEMEPDGIGALYMAFEQLKEKLEKKGMFEARYKKPIPSIPNRIGVITSPTGAAVRDILTTISRRFPLVETVVLPVLVQGPNAPESIVQAIEKANDLGSFDVLIVGRGGGSIEELWSFNEEAVAEAIFNSRIPIISAVGHETDTTISDFVADLRAPTPTGAAELAVPSRIELMERSGELGRRLQRALGNLHTENSKMLKRLMASYAFRYPEQLITQKDQQLDAAVDRLALAFKNKLDKSRNDLRQIDVRLMQQHPERQLQSAESDRKALAKDLRQAMQRLMDKKQSELGLQIEKLSLLNPLEIMKRGFSVPYGADGEIIRSVRQVEQGERISVKLADGQAECQVLETKEDING
ncbi:exodeoxyribonuclease VII large subunit [Aciduricibacillus chroicocephali]|uniref:Exodeoxyribonuclease 7 large subunit n=1 Tax=Aciduricibacillus chroicocephali TaxID=3054939 RepID=A0ABY9KSM9_9BACI|nr:exodeoxyribonuclease VII large subunit [Bacillaceae bacterium 44XB]